MRDAYPDFPALPAEWLVAPEDQPEYTEIDGLVLDESIDLGTALSDAHVAAGRGADIAIIHHESGRSYTFAELASASDALRGSFERLGVQPGDRVAVRVPNRPEGIIAQIAAWKLGAVVVPIPFLARGSELRFFFDDVLPKLLVTDPDQFEMVAEVAAQSGVFQVISLADVVPPGVESWRSAVATSGSPRAGTPPLDAVGIVWHTGGTTGVPKGCYHTQRRLLMAGHSYALATGAAPGQVWAAAAPIGHALGVIYHTIFSLLHGATVVLVEGFADPVVLLAAIRSHRVSVFTAIAASWAGMQKAIEAGATAPDSLERGYAMWQSSTGGELVAAWRERGIELLNNFGSTAFANWVLIARPDTGVPQAALGRPTPGYEVRVVDPDSGADVADGTVGRLIVRGPTGLTYWRRPEKQRADVRGGWVHVDDLVQRVGDVDYAYRGRTDFMISSAGNKIAPSEVEEVLGRHPAVKEVCVVGLPDAVRQEVVAAFVVVADGTAPSDELRRELQDLVKRELSPYKYPRVLEWLDRLPRDHVGKVLPARVRDHASNERRAT